MTVQSGLWLSSNSEIVASGLDNKTVRLWDAAMGEVKQKFQTSDTVSRIAFSRNGSNLETNAGRLDLGTVLATCRALVTKSPPAILFEGSWVKQGGVEFLWLLHKYRRSPHDAHGSLLAIGQPGQSISRSRKARRGREDVPACSGWRGEGTRA